MKEYRINGLTIKENLLQLAGNGNKKFTESLHPGIENVLVCFVHSGGLNPPEC